MIHEEGALQIIDFGVAGMLHSESDKRKTMIGTPHWMGPEALAPQEQGYGTEVSDRCIAMPSALPLLDC